MTSDPIHWIGRNAKRILTLLIGFAIMVAGVAMLALPGPGILVIILGLLVLATEFSWAEQALDRLKKTASDALATVNGNEVGRRASIASGIFLILAGVGLAVFVSGFVIAGVALAVAGVLGLGLLSPQLQQWIDDQASEGSPDTRDE